MYAHRMAGILVVAAWCTAACSERSAPLAPRPAADAAALSSTGFIGDRPYTWSFKCNGDGEIWATWSWTENGTVLATISAECVGNGQLSSTGVRPATANGFTASVAGLGGGNSKSWTFDPAEPFKANLSASIGGGGGKNNCTFGCFPKESGQLSVAT